MEKTQETAKLAVQLETLNQVLAPLDEDAVLQVMEQIGAYVDGWAAALRMASARKEAETA